MFSIAGSLILGGKIDIRKNGNLWLKISGILFILLWFLSGLSGLILTIPGLNYFSGFSTVGWNDYHGDYLVGGYCIWLLQLSILTGLIGGFLISLDKMTNR